MARLTIEMMRDIAGSRGGVCLSGGPVQWDASLHWRCAEGHEWHNRAGKVKSGQWCPVCAGLSPKGLPYLQKLAEKMGGECLSQEYRGMQNLAQWRCQHGHTWDAKPNNVRYGNWCPFCAGRRQTISDLQALAKARGGKCLSKKYTGQATKHLWRCINNHEWSASPRSIQSGSWCPHCNINFGEEICRIYLEKIFGKPFPKVRPKFLVSANGKPLELDGFCKDLMLAFEHHGIQHYKLSPAYHRENSDLIAQKQRDIEKISLCKKAGIRLLVIPAIPEITPTDELPALIQSQLATLGIRAPVISENIPIELSKIYRKSDIQILKTLARSRGGVLLSRIYLGDKGKLRWQCQKKHEWLAKPTEVKKGTWCPYCYGNVRKSHSSVKESARIQGITLVDIDYKGTNAKHTWECVKGHRWQATPHKVLIDGTGCPFCVGKHKTISDMVELAGTRGGSCLSSTYLGRHKLLEWQCDSGHVFSMTPAYATSRKDNWCPVCNKIKTNKERAEKEQDKIQTIVLKKGGRIVSGDYVTTRSKFLFECNLRHNWEASASSIKRGSWCPYCARRRNE